MSVFVFQISPSKDIPIPTQASTLDGITRALPQGFYTTFSTVSHGTKVLGLKAHLERLYDPAWEKGIVPTVDAPTLRNRISEFARLNLPQESRIRIILTKDMGAVYIGIQPFEPISKSIYEKGVSVITTELARQSPRIKDTKFISESINLRKQVGKDVFEVLLVKKGKILEGMTSNFHVIKGKTLVTAQRGILLGVTRRVILRLARGQGMSIQYRSLSINEKINEAFLTSSSRGVVPIISIDDKSVGQGRVGKWTKLLSKEYQAYVKERSEFIIE